jgi:hypothetical protein
MEMPPGAAARMSARRLTTFQEARWRLVCDAVSGGGWRAPAKALEARVGPLTRGPTARSARSNRGSQYGRVGSGWVAASRRVGMTQGPIIGNEYADCIFRLISNRDCWTFADDLLQECQSVKILQFTAIRTWTWRPRSQSVARNWTQRYFPASRGILAHHLCSNNLVCLAAERGMIEAPGQLPQNDGDLSATHFENTSPSARCASACPERSGLAFVCFSTFSLTPGRRGRSN